MSKYKFLLSSFLCIISFLTSYYVFSTINNSSLSVKDPDDRGWLQRTYPFYNADPNAFMNALAQHNTLIKEQMSALAKNALVPEWEFAGPVNISGRIVDIEYNPLDPSVIYAAAATGGIFKTTNNGEEWFPVFDSLSTLNIGDIGIDPINPDIIYAGTGEANGGHNNFPGAGIFKSIDAGNTWTHIGLNNTASIARIIVDYTNPQVVFAAAVGSYFSPNPERGVYKSTDGGDTWNKSLFVSDSTGAIDILMDPVDHNILFASMWERVRRPNSSHLSGPSSNIYKSTDGGLNWTRLLPSSGLPDPSITNVGRIGLSQCKTSPNIIYALYNDGYNYSGLYKTTNYGTTWTNSDPSHGISTGVSNFSWYFGQVRVHPENPNIVYVLDVELMKTTDGGNSWFFAGGNMHVDNHALIYNPTNSNKIICGNDGGLYQSSDGGDSWSTRAFMPVSQFYEIGLDYTNPERLYGGTQDNSTIRTTTGAINDWETILGGDGFYVIVDPVDPNIIYAEYQNGGLNKSTNGGNSFSGATNGINTSEPMNWSTPVVMDPNNRSVLYFGTLKLYRTTNSAASWTAISPKLTDWFSGSRTGTISTIAVAPSNSDYIYVGTDDSKVWVTTNGGANWTNISNGLPNRWVTRVAVDPHNANKVYVTFSGLKWRDPQPHVFKSSNTGQSWTDISNNLPDAPVNAFAVDNNDPSILYLGNDIGAYTSIDDGASWSILGKGLPVVVVNDLKIHPTENFLIAGTHGRSMYKLQLNTISGVKNDIIAAADYKLEQNYPNPFNPSTIIQYSIANESRVTLKIYDILGKELTTLVNGVLPAGSHKAEFNASSLGKITSSGVYFYRIVAEDIKGKTKFTDTRKLIYMK